MPPRGGVHALPAQHLGGDALPQVNHNGSTIINSSPPLISPHDLSQVDLGDWTSRDHRGGVKRAFVSPIGGTELFRLPTQGLLLMTLANVVTGITTISMSGRKLTILANLTHAPCPHLLS